MYSLIILLSRGRMSDYADFNSNGSVALHIIVILVIAGFFLYGAEVFTVILIIGFVLYAIIERWRYKNK